jgi:hypothetical protein
MKLLVNSFIFLKISCTVKETKNFLYCALG